MPICLCTSWMWRNCIYAIEKYENFWTQKIKQGFNIDAYLPVYHWEVENILIFILSEMLREVLKLKMMTTLVKLEYVEM